MSEKTLQTISRLLSPQPTLNPLVFGSGGQMHEDLRRRLLWRMQTMFKRIFGGFRGLELEDVILCGSQAGYLWYEHSDFDIRLKIGVDGSKFFISQPQIAISFLSKFFVAHRGEYRLDNRKIDIVLRVRNYTFAEGAYSLMQDCWINCPPQDMTCALDKDIVYMAVCRVQSRIAVRLENMMRNEKGLISLEDLQKLHRLHYYLARCQYRNVLGYVVWKVLRNEDMNKVLIWFYATEISKTLSYVPEDNNG